MALIFIGRKGGAEHLAGHPVFGSDLAANIARFALECHRFKLRLFFGGWRGALGLALGKVRCSHCCRGLRGTGRCRGLAAAVATTKEASHTEYATDHHQCGRGCREDHPHATALLLLLATIAAARGAAVTAATEGTAASEGTGASTSSGSC